MLLRFRLAASAFVPGLLIAAIRLWDISTVPWWSLALAATAVVATTSLALLIRARSTLNAQPATVRGVEDESHEVPAFLLTYVFPFVFLSVANWRDAVAYAVFGVILLVLIFRTRIWKVNPLLLLTGLHTYSVQIDGTSDIVLFARSRPSDGQTIQVVTLSSGALKQV